MFNFLISLSYSLAFLSSRFSVDSIISSTIDYGLVKGSAASISSLKINYSTSSYNSLTYSKTSYSINRNFFFVRGFLRFFFFSLILCYLISHDFIFIFVLFVFFWLDFFKFHLFILYDPFVSFLDKGSSFYYIF